MHDKHKTCNKPNLSNICSVCCLTKTSFCRNLLHIMTWAVMCFVKWNVIKKLGPVTSSQSYRIVNNNNYGGDDLMACQTEDLLIIRILYDYMQTTTTLTTIPLQNDVTNNRVSFFMSQFIKPKYLKIAQECPVKISENQVDIKSKVFCIIYLFFFGVSEIYKNTMYISTPNCRLVSLHT